MYAKPAWRRRAHSVDLPAPRRGGQHEPHSIRRHGGGVQREDVGITIDHALSEIVHQAVERLTQRRSTPSNFTIERDDPQSTVARIRPVEVETRQRARDSRRLRLRVAQALQLHLEELVGAHSMSKRRLRALHRKRVEGTGSDYTPLRFVRCGTTSLIRRPLTSTRSSSLDVTSARLPSTIVSSSWTSRQDGRTASTRPGPSSGSASTACRHSVT